VALGVAVVAMFIAVFLVLIPGVALGWFRVKPGTTEMDFDNLPMFFLNNLGLAVCLPLGLFIHWLIFRQRPIWLISIRGRLNWRWIARVALIVLVIEAASFAVEAALGGMEGASWQPDGLLILLVVLFTTPFQAAAEEVVIRGLMLRCIGSMFRWRWPGLAVSALLSALCFMLLHGAGDIWLNAFYLTFGLTSAVLVWRTGSLEASIVLHIIHNVVAEASLPFVGLEGLFDREAGVGSPALLIPLGLNLAATTLILWQAKRLHLPNRAPIAAKNI
jgi:membrane protease YdiL (CAAX protease family)